MKKLRKWFRILHRDLGFFFIGTSLIYALSGLALNHLGDWNPSYIINTRKVNFKCPLTKGKFDKKTFIQELKKNKINAAYTNHYFPNKNTIKIFLDKKSSVIVDIKTGEGNLELVNKRPVFNQLNYLHYNPNAWWKWFSDIFAVSLIFLAISSFFIVRGKKGIWGTGGIYFIAGLIIPVLIFIFT